MNETAPKKDAIETAVEVIDGIDALLAELPEADEKSVIKASKKENDTAVDRSKLQDRNGVKYLLNEETPLRGGLRAFTHITGRSCLKRISRTARRMGFGLSGTRTGRRFMNQTTRTASRTGFRLLGTRTGRRWRKEMEGRQEGRTLDLLQRGRDRNASPHLQGRLIPVED